MFEFWVVDSGHPLDKPTVTCPLSVQMQVTYQHQVTVEVLDWVLRAPRIVEPKKLKGYVIGVTGPSFVSGDFWVAFLRHIALTNLRLSTGF